MTRSLFRTFGFLQFLAVFVVLATVVACGGGEEESTDSPTLPTLQDEPSDDEPLVSDPGATANVIGACASAVVDPAAYTRSLRSAMSQRLPRGAKPRVRGLAATRTGEQCHDILPVALGTLNYDTYTQGYWGQDEVWQLLIQVIQLLYQRGQFGGGYGGSVGNGCAVDPYVHYSQGGWGAASQWGGWNGGACQGWLYQNPFQYYGGQVPWNFGYGW